MEAVLFKKDQKESVQCESETELGTADNDKWQKGKEKNGSAQVDKAKHMQKKWDAQNQDL